MVEANEKILQRVNDKKAKDELVILKKIQDHLKEGKVNPWCVAKLVHIHKTSILGYSKWNVVWTRN